MPSPHRHSLLFLSGTSILLALVATLIASLLVKFIDLVTNIAFYQRLSAEPASPAHNQLGPWVIIVPVIGGIIIGLMARYGSKAIRGHGIPEAMEQVLQNRSRIPARITVLKPMSAAISIGTGGPFGAEGPIIATGGALGSLVGQIFSVTGGERKTLLAAGAAAGMTAIFGSPVSAVLLAVELLLFEFSIRSIVPVGLACATAAAARLCFFHPGAVFHMPSLTSPGAGTLALMAILGALMGVAATFVSRAVYWVEEQFERLPIHWMWWPALGAIAVGVIGYIAPRTLGVGYNNIEDILSDALPLQVVAWLCGMKLLSWLIALGSGTSGGTLAPLLTIGSGCGVLAAAGMHWLMPGVNVQPGLAALVGMAAMFAGASRALLASVVFAFETTLHPDALPALLAGATTAYLVANLISQHSIMTERIARRGVVVPNSLQSEPLHQLSVAAVMETELQTVPASMPLAELSRRIGENDPVVSRRQASLVIDDTQSLAGIITRGDVIHSLHSEQEDATVLEVCSRNLIVTHPDESLHDALLKMLQHNIGRLPVVERNAPTRPVGYLGRAHLLGARSRQIEEEHQKEPGWLQSILSRTERTRV